MLKYGGTLAFWGYSDPVFVDYPDASLILNKYVYLDSEYLGPYWEYPGTNLLRGNYRDVTIPSDLFTEVIRVEHEPGTRNDDALVLKRSYTGTEPQKADQDLEFVSFVEKDESQRARCCRCNV